MLLSQRVLFSDNGSLSDLSVSVNNFRADTSTLPIVAAQDYIYIGNELPFNHKYIDVSTANDQASVISSHIWFSKEWTDAVDLIDQTSSGGVTLASPGLLTWNTDWLKGWDREQDSSDVTGLTGTDIYNFYWVRLSFSADLKATTAINFIGDMFCTEDQVFSYYPDLDNQTLKDAFEPGSASGTKTTWNEQIFMASRNLLNDLKRRNIIRSDAQILDTAIFEEPAIHQVASLIFGAMGEPYKDRFDFARKMYSETINMKRYRTDANMDGTMTDVDRIVRAGFLSR